MTHGSPREKPLHRAEREFIFITAPLALGGYSLILNVAGGTTVRASGL